MAGRTLVMWVAAPVLVVAGVFLSAGSAWAASSSSSARLSGSAEVGGAGDAKASGAATVSVDTGSGQVCATVTSDVKNAAAMHIHQGAVGVNGPVVVTLDAKKINAGRSCAVAKAVAGQIAANPAGFYVNVHTPAFPAGAVRGQLAAAAPTGVAAGSGGWAATGSGTDLAVVIVLLAAGAGLVGAAGWRLSRR